MTSTRAEFGLGKSRMERRSLPPSGESANRRARTPSSKPPAALAPNPPEERAGEGIVAGAAGMGTVPPLLAPLVSVIAT